MKAKTGTSVNREQITHVVIVASFFHNSMFDDIIWYIPFTRIWIATRSDYLVTRYFSKERTNGLSSFFYAFEMKSSRTDPLAAFEHKTVEIFWKQDNFNSLKCSAKRNWTALFESFTL